MHWNGEPASDAELEGLMAEAANKASLPELQLRVDHRVDYGRVAGVLALASLLVLSFTAVVS